MNTRERKVTRGDVFELKKLWEKRRVKDFGIKRRSFSELHFCYFCFLCERVKEEKHDQSSNSRTELEADETRHFPEKPSYYYRRK